jgi:hypothetical protein
MQVININDKTEKKRREDLLEVLDDFRKKVENGEIDEFVLASIDKQGEIMLHTVIKDAVGGIGLFEVGKSILIQQQQMIDIYD